MILVDTNILMYAAGAEHPNKAPCIHFLAQVATGKIDAAIDTETLQEILHRYRSLKRWEEGRQVYDAAREIFSATFPVTVDILDQARILMDEHETLWARDALHAAVAQAHGIETLCSYDKDFDKIPGVERIEPNAPTLPYHSSQ